MKKTWFCIIIGALFFCHSVLIGQSYPLGIIDNKPTYFGWNFTGKKLTLTLEKYNPETLVSEEKKSIVVPFTTKFKFVEPQQTMYGYYLNDKYYFFYSLFYGISRNYVTICNEDFSVAKTIKLGAVSGNSYNHKFIASISPDHKTALIYNKTYCRNDDNSFKEADCREHQLLFFDLIKDTVRNNKNIPDKMDDFFLKTSQYKIDNNDNITCIASIEDPKADFNTITATSTAILKKEDEKLNITEVKVGDTKRVISYLIRSKTGDVAYFGVLDSKVIFRFIPLDKTKKNFEISFSNKSFINSDHDTSIVFNVSESETGYFLSLINKRGNYSAAFVNKTGELVWHKPVPSIQTVYKYVYDQNFETSSFVSENKLYFVFLENKPYEESGKAMKALKNSDYIMEYDRKKLNTTLVSIDESGKIKKEVILDNAESYANPQKSIISNKGILYLYLGSQLKKVLLN